MLLFYCAATLVLRSCTAAALETKALLRDPFHASATSKYRAVASMSLAVPQIITAAVEERGVTTAAVRLPAGSLLPAAANEVN